LIPFSNELSTLEMRLYELDEFVDQFFIIESTRTHRYGKKPLVFSRNFERFLRFRHKIIHIVLDDSDADAINKIQNPLSSDDWSLEKQQRKILWNTFRKLVPDISSEDLIIHGDADELPQADIINHLKYCKPKVLPLMTQAMFYRFNFEWVHTEYSIGIPEIFSINNIKEGDPIRGLKGAVSIPWSGIHLSDYGLPALYISKLIGLAEGGSRSQMIQYLKDPDLLMERMRKGIRPCCPDSQKCIRYENIHDGPKEKIIPWVALANKEHFPEMFPSEFPNFLNMRKPRYKSTSL